MPPHTQYPINLPNEKLACITIDFEMDYGWRIRQFNILKENRTDIDRLTALLKALDVPMSAFIVTHLLEDMPETIDLIQNLASDWHCHSHTHNTESFDSQFEIQKTAHTFQQVFGRAPLGYRAPLGVLQTGDIELLGEYGFRFSSSVFPGIRPGLFNHLDQPTSPFFYENGMMELPLAVIPKIRLVIALSYLKLLGYRVNKALYKTFGLPNILIFNTHLHDFILNETSFRQLPPTYRRLWNHNRYKGFDYFERFISLLRTQGYQFITMTELYEQLQTNEDQS